MIQFRSSSPGSPFPVALSQRRICLVAEGCLLTLGSPIAALLLQGPSGVASEGSSTSIFDLVTRSYLTLGVLSLLGLMSIVSWGVILYKLWVFRRTDRQTSQFLDVFRRSNKF